MSISASIHDAHTARLEELRQEVYSALRQGAAEWYASGTLVEAVEAACTYTELRAQISNILSALDHGEPWAGRFWLMGALMSIVAKVGEARADLEREVFGIGR